MNRLMTAGLVAALFVSGAVWAAPAKNDADAKAAEDARSQHFKDMGKAWEPIANMLRRKIPYDAAVVDKQSAQVAEMSKKIPSLFEIDTRAFKDLKTESLDGIWSSVPDFNSKSEALTSSQKKSSSPACLSERKNGPQFAETNTTGGVIVDNWNE